MSVESLYQKDNDDNDDYPTPSWIKIMFEGWHDPNPLNNDSLREFDALGALPDSVKKVYLNPPYGKPGPWVDAAIKWNKQGKTVALLMKLDTSTKWFLKLQEAQAHFITFFGRLQFGDRKPAPFPCFIAILEPKASPQTGEGAGQR